MTTPMVQRLVETFERIHRERMRGLPIVHPDLEVEAVGFRSWEAGEIGVLITPWFMNLTYLVPPPNGWDQLPLGHVLILDFPAGPYSFVLAEAEGLGRYRNCALFTTMQPFADRAQARETAEAVMKGLFLAASPERSGGMSRREFLQGVLRGGRK
ncbi:MAG: [NiFe]-hydrogenase assembly chaperone HybE [Gammaproteobacteria bacterium]|jgi:[NiFe] hydrogenase assembly HybE family chaperone